MFALPGIRCNTCRLRSLIRIRELARSRRAVRSLAGTTWKGLPRSKRGIIDGARTTVKSRARDDDGLGILNQREQVRLIESLYSSGQITREEWRGSVWVQAGLQRRDVGVEDTMRRLKEWYAGDEVPGELLEDGERRVYERLFGGVGELEELEDVLEDDGGTGVLREGRDGGLVEVEFEEEGVEEKRRKKNRGDEVLEEDIRLAMERDNVEDGEEAESGDDVLQRTHPLTLANRFATNPSTLLMPRHQLTEPIEAMLANISNKHISDHAHRIFGGPGLPYSTSTSARARQMPQKPIALDAYQSSMAEIEADVYIASLIPPVYASVMAVLVETRKKLGTAWARDLVKKAEKGELKILDAGGAGAGVLAVRELLRAEWESMLEDDLGTPMALAEVDGKLGGEGARPPLGQATILTGSDTLRKRAATLLENTTFVPRLPDYVHTEEAKLKGKFDIVIAPNTLWPLKEDYIRKTHVQNLWSLARAEWGVLVLLEKGVPRGFEMIAGARDMLLETRIATPESPDRSLDISEQAAESDLMMEKEPAMIVAPCTNHTACPMYNPKGHIKGRKEICAFAQRYHRPPFLQRIFGTKGRNHEDVEFSYISLLRGKSLPENIQQTTQATDLAFDGFEGKDHVEALQLPRMVLPPWKRKGHVILDLCTPAGTLERWTVPRSFSKQAYRDARKSSWGDLWALGAKTRIPRKIVVRKRDFPEREEKKKEREVRWDFESDEFGEILVEDDGGAAAGERELDGGRVRVGRKVKGIRDKRDKKGDGRGRRKNRT